MLLQGQEFLEDGPGESSQQGAIDPLVFLTVADGEF